MDKNISNFFSNYLSNIIDVVNGSIYWKDKDGVYLGCNNYAAMMVGLASKEEIEGKTDYDLFTKEEADIFREHDLQIMAEDTELTREESVTSPDGKKLIQLSFKKPLYNHNGEIIGIVGTTVDITKEKEAMLEAAKEHTRAEAEESIRKVISTYAGIIAHDQRSPIVNMSLIGRKLKSILPLILALNEKAKLYNIEESSLIDEHIDFLQNVGDKIEERVTAMNDIVDNALNTINVALKIHKGEDIQSELTICNIASSISKPILRSLYPQFNDDIIHLHGKNFRYLGNKIVMDQIIMNLLNNAMYQINKNGKGEIFIELLNFNNMNILTFKDTAGGAPKEVVKQMFDDYYTTKSEGTGVGLAFCKQSMKLFGGDITAESFGGEMEFTLTFPKVE